jgi:hypothetical protein
VRLKSDASTSSFPIPRNVFISQVAQVQRGEASSM